MTTCSPREYLTLPTGPTENYSTTQKLQTPNETYGTLTFNKVGLDLERKVILAGDWTFANDSGVHYGSVENQTILDGYPLFGKAFACPEGDIGEMRVNLVGTGFFIPEFVINKPISIHFEVTVHVDTPHVKKIDCSGYCGGCILHDSRVPYESGTPALERVIPVQYDATLDQNTCSLT